MSILAQMFGPIMALLTFAGKEFAGWVERRDSIKEVTLQAEIATIRAKAELAAYRVKSDIEWDLAWAGQAQSSWKDEYLLILWTLPAVIFVPCLMVPLWRDYAMDTLMFLQGLHPQIIEFYLAGWGIIFAAVFGVKQAIQMMVPEKVRKITEAFSQIPDDIPEDVVASVTRSLR